MDLFPRDVQECGHPVPPGEAFCRACRDAAAGRLKRMAAADSGAKAVDAPARWWLAALIATVLALPAVAWCGSTVDREYTRGEDSRQWPSATGRVLTSRWEMHTSCDDNGCDDDYHVHLSYEYQVGGRRYMATRYRFGWPFFGDQSDVERIVSKYPADNQVPVYYSPLDPGVSTLRPGLAWGNFIMALVGLTVVVILAWVWALFGIASALRHIIPRRDERAPGSAWGAPLEAPDDWEGPGRLGADR